MTLPPRPTIGRRERWMLVAIALLPLEAAATALGAAVPAEHVAIVLTLIGAFVAADTWRPSGMRQ